jgi:hypothetical protein
MVRSRFPNATKAQIREILAQKPHDVGKKTISENSKHMNKVFDNHRHGWMHDIVSLNGALYHVFIGTNTRYVVIYPIESKSTKAVLSTLTKFLKDEKAVSLTSDSEPAFVSKPVLELLAKHKVDSRIVTESRHTGLSILDRFVRTIRDMIHTSNHGKGPKASLNKLITIYNKSLHTAIDMTPKEMYNSKEKEVEYIYYMLAKQQEIKSQEGYDIPIGTKVRVMLPKRTLNKTRFKVSPTYYTVSDKEGISYIVMAKDGSTKTVSRFQMFPLGKNTSLEHTPTTGETSRGEVTEIIKYYPKTDKYKVRFTIPGQKDVFDTIPATYLRLKHPNRKSQMEIDFFTSHHT